MVAAATKAEATVTPTVTPAVMDRTAVAVAVPMEEVLLVVVVEVTRCPTWELA